MTSRSVDLSYLLHIVVAVHSDHADTMALLPVAAPPVECGAGRLHIATPSHCSAQFLNSSKRDKVNEARTVKIHWLALVRV